MKIFHPPQVPPNSRSPSLPTATTQGLQTLQGLAPRPGPDLHQPTSGDDHGRWQPSSPPYPPSPAAAPSGAPSGSPPFQSHLRNLPPRSPTDLAIRSALAAGVPHTTLPTSSHAPPTPRSSVSLTCGTGPPGQPPSFLLFLSSTISLTFPAPPRNHLHHPASGRRLPNPTKGGNPEELGVRQQQPKVKLNCQSNYDRAVKPGVFFPRKTSLIRMNIYDLTMRISFNHEDIIKIY